MGRGNHRNIMHGSPLPQGTHDTLRRSESTKEFAPPHRLSTRIEFCQQCNHQCRHTSVPAKFRGASASSNWSIRRHQLPNPNAIRHRNVTWINPAALLASYCSITILTLIRILWLSPGSHRKTSTTWRKAASSGSILPTRAKIRVMLLASQQNPGRLWRWRLHS
jgi:hypothetical protein